MIAKARQLSDLGPIKMKKIIRLSWEGAECEEGARSPWNAVDSGCGLPPDRAL